MNQTCLGRAAMVYRRSIVGATFVDYPERTNIPHGGLINLGGPRAPARWRRWPWTEVLHSPGWGRGMVDGQLWMYIARGSGLWFDPGLVLELSDTYDLAVFLNATKNYNPRSAGSKAGLMNLAIEQLAGHYDSIAFAYHVDGGCCHRMVMRELVSLHNFSRRCPVSSSLARGWPPHELWPCNCSRIGVC